MYAKNYFIPHVFETSENILQYQSYATLKNFSTFEKKNKKHLKCFTNIVFSYVSNVSTPNDTT